jgi:hypothetical protein
MTKEEVIKKATEFEAELSALAVKYGVCTYSFVSFMDDGSKASYPIMVHWVADGEPADGRHPRIIKLCFQGSVALVRSITGKGLLHEQYSGFGRFDTGMRDL